MTDLERALRNWVTDWDGKPMSRGEPPRDGIHCDVLYDAINALASRKDAIDDIAELKADISRLLESLRLAEEEIDELRVRLKERAHD